jgi:hypothetical protein
VANINIIPALPGNRVLVHVNGQKRFGYMMGYRKDSDGKVIFFRLRLDGDLRWTLWKPENVGVLPKKLYIGDWVRHNVPAGPNHLGEGKVTKVSEDGMQIHFLPKGRRDSVMVLATRILFCSHGAESLKAIKAEKDAYKKLKAEEEAAAKLKAEEGAEAENE